MGNYKSRSALAVLICMMGLSCVKDPQDIPSGLDGNPVFGLHGQFGSDQIHQDAGIDLWTFVPTIEQGDSLYIYSSTLSMDRCLDNCPSSWTFNVYQNVSSLQGQEEKFLNTVKPGPIDFVLSDVERESYVVTVGTHPDLFMNGVSFWEDLNNPDTTYASTLVSTVSYQEGFNACFQSAVYAGCQYQQCIHFDPSTGVPCTVHIEAQVVLDSGRYVILTAKPDGVGPFQIQWADGPTSSSVVIPIQNLTTDIAVDVTVTDINGNSTELLQNVRLQDGIVDVCYYPISVSSTTLTDYSTALAAGDLEVIHIDEAGAQWRSTGAIQPAESFAQVNSVDYFSLSPGGFPAYKVSLSLKVLLTNVDTGESRWFETSDLTLPLGHY
jgi:hypothetical protein